MLGTEFPVVSQVRRKQDSRLGHCRFGRDQLPIAQTNLLGAAPKIMSTACQDIPIGGSVRASPDEG